MKGEVHYVNHYDIAIYYRNISLAINWGNCSTQQKTMDICVVQFLLFFKVHGDSFITKNKTEALHSRQCFVCLQTFISSKLYNWKTRSASKTRFLSLVFFFRVFLYPDIALSICWLLIFLQFLLIKAPVEFFIIIIYYLNKKSKRKNIKFK